ncbi:MAG: hypothetical protein M3Y41_06850 [Pseudomonadota bacterium]|nr:hypothetical protein [Pseudomonadota bacterium]
MGVGAIGAGASLSGSAGGSPPSRPATLGADLAKYEAQLSDWTFCASGKSPEGKAKIVQLNDRITSIKTQIHKADRAAIAARAAAPAPSAAPVRSAGPMALGNLVDVYA